MKKLFALVLALPLFAAAQKSTFSVAAEYRNIKEIGSGYGGTICLGIGLTKLAGIGISAGAVKFSDLKGPYYPVLANVHVGIPSPGILKFDIMAEAGYGIYSYTNNAVYTHRETMKGGVTYDGGIRISILRKSPVAPFIFLGYAQSSFKATDIYVFATSEDKVDQKFTKGGMLVRAGIRF